MAEQATLDVTRLLAEFAARLRFDDLPERSREHCKNLILDALACAVAGHQGEETRQVAKHDVTPSRMRRIAVGLSQSAFDMHGSFATYKGKFEALLSAHYAAAAILHDRALSLAQFAPERYDDPALRAFAADKVDFRADPSVSGSQAKIEIIL